MNKETEENKANNFLKNASNKNKIQENELKNIVNTINFYNFQDRPLSIIFRHIRKGREIVVKAHPNPCLNDHLECSWTTHPPSSHLYEFQRISIYDGLKLTTISPKLTFIDNKKVIFDLSKAERYETISRKIERFTIEGIEVVIYQNSLMYDATLRDFSADSFRVELYLNQKYPISYINKDHPISLIFRDKYKEIIFSGECRITHHRVNEYVLEPIQKGIQRFSTKEFRSERYKLVPLPNATFINPVTQKMQMLRIEEISGSGISVIERFDKSTLIPGMIITNLTLEFANNISIKCTGQVIHRSDQKSESANRYVKYGIAVIDMSIRDQTRLSNILHKAKHQNCGVCTKVDVDNLWKFFFETGFIYPEKYSYISQNKKKFKETYEKLYINSPNLARHFVYQENGEILGHIAMIRVYDSTWLFHHHAANQRKNIRAGTYVLDQISNYVNDFYNLKSTNMRYIICCFRPQNVFPSHFFGRFAKNLNDRKGCSVDSFTFLKYHKMQANRINIQELIVTGATREDLEDLIDLYRRKSDGVMLSAMDIYSSQTFLSEEYKRAGLKREIQWLSIRTYSELKAVAMVCISEVGLNLSDLTNCIYLFVIDQDNFTREEFFQALQELSRLYQEDYVQVMIFPSDYAPKKEIYFEKTYTLWALDVPRSVDKFYKFMYSLYKRKQQ